jgi:hypothetical protein
MVRIKTADLIGAQLDWAVAKAEDYADIDIIDHIPIMDEAPPSWCKANGHPFSPSTTWSHGGPIIERERMMVSPALEEGCWYAKRFQTVGYGKSPLIAAMRAFVASKLGDEVGVPQLEDTSHD